MGRESLRGFCVPATPVLRTVVPPPPWTVTRELIVTVELTVLFDKVDASPSFIKEFSLASFWLIGRNLEFVKDTPRSIRHSDPFSLTPVSSSFLFEITKVIGALLMIFTLVLRCGESTLFGAAGALIFLCAGFTEAKSDCNPATSMLSQPTSRLDVEDKRPLM